MLNNKKIVIFDYGGIVFNLQDETSLVQIWKNVANRLNLNVSDEYLRQWKSWDFDMTTDNYEQVNEDFYRIFKSCGIEADTALIKKCRLIFDDEIKKAPKYAKVADFINTLISSGKCLTGVLSNLSVCYAPAINTQLPLSAFDYVWISFEMGCQKPEDKIYEKVEQDCRQKPSDILFFDDTAENIIAAKKRGWNVCQIDETQDEALRVALISKTIENFLNDKQE
ncbi:MAG: HAD-IA family hydrolase [Alphaproteobacteria bacterium]|nr:HAD-IA family hydrolase [Alphaproteobacteria bacterium]